MPRCADLAVVGGPLVRVLAVGEVELLAERDHDLLREGLPSREPAHDGGLVGGGVREGGGCQRASRRERDLARFAKLGEHRLVLGRGADRRHLHEVLRGRAKHRRAADVDHLDRLFLTHTLAPGDLVEGVEVDDDEIERRDPVPLEVEPVRLLAAVGEDAAVDLRVEGDDPVVEHLGNARDLLDRHDGSSGLPDHLGGSARRDELDAQLGQPAGESVEAGLVVGGEERAANHSRERKRSSTSCRATRGRSRCSTAWRRSSRTSAVSPGRIATGS